MDSRPETLKHIETVQQTLNLAVAELLSRALLHDQSKLVSPEVEVFDEFTPKLAGSTYGSDEYKATLVSMKLALDHHYAANDHHPEHFTGGIADMNLFQLMEMLCDWIAASKRHKYGDIRHSLDLNQRRYGYSDELKAILLNTLPVLED